MSKEDDEDKDDNSLGELLDKPFFDPNKYEEDDSSLAGWFANLVKSNYELAETLYVGTVFVILIIITQEVLRFQIYGDGYHPFTKGVGGGSLF
jgi:hypothetical protein